MSKKETGLGKGLGALIPSVRFDKDEKGFSIPSRDKEDIASISKIPISKIVKNPYQPRKTFDPEALEELTESIKLHGVIQPITVRKVEDGYELIAGERRLRASQLAGLVEIPANILVIESGQKMLELALIENIQRHDLNPIEEALAYQQLIEECGLTQEQAAIRVSKERSTVANLLRLLKLPPATREHVRSGSISLGHAKVLLGLKDDGQIDRLAEEVIEDKLSIKQLNERIRKPKKSESSLPPPQSATIQNDPFIADVENRLRSEYGTDVRIKMKENETGSIEIKFYSASDLDRIVSMMNLKEE
jgi:ParB family chromosome partitioning protein